MKVYTYILFAIILCTLVRQSKCQEWYEVGNPHFLDTSNVFEAIKQQKAIKILKFFSPWCKYCRYIKNYMDNYKNSQKLSSKLKFYQFNCQSNGPMFCAQHFQVGAYPAVIIFNEAGDRVSRIDGLYPQQVIHNILKQFNEKAIPFEDTTQNAKKPQIAQPQKPKNQQTKNYETANVVNAAQNPKQKIQQQKKEQQKKQQKQQQKKQQKKQQKNQQKKQQRQQQKKVEQKKQERKQQNKIQNKQQKKQQSKQQSKQQHKFQQKQQNKVEIIKQELPLKKQETLVLKKEQLQIDEGQKKVENGVKVQKSAEADKENNKQTNKMVKNETEEGTHWFKYLIYCLGGGAGGIYAYRIFTSKKQSNQPMRSTKKQDRKIQQKSPTTRLNSQDIEHNILVEEVVDQNL